MIRDWTLAAVVTGLKRFGDRPAIVAMRGDALETLSYARLHHEALRLAAGLAAVGIGPGEPVAVIAANSPAWITVRLGLIGSGAMAVPLDPLTDEDALRRVLAEVGIRHAFAGVDLAPTLRRAAGGQSLAIHLLDADAAVGAARPWRELLAAQPGETVHDDPDDVAALFFTSGTTGAPKGVPLSHRNIMANLAALIDLRVTGLGDRVLLPLPLHHAYPFIVGMLTPLASGSAIVLPEAVAGPAILTAIRAARVTGIVGVPRLYEAMLAGIEVQVRGRGAIARLAVAALLATADEAKRRLGIRLGAVLFRGLRRQVGPDLRFLVSGGARLEPRTEAQLAGFGWDVLNGWGLVETASVATFNPPDDVRPGTVGRPGPGVALRIDQPDDSGVGEVLVRGPNVFAGYYKNPEADREAFTPDGWFRTGDLGYLDARGFLVVTGRAKELIVLAGGKNVAPEEVERVYARSVLVREIAVLEHAGALVALVVPDLEAARAAGTARIDDILRVALAEAAQTLPPYKRISGYAIVREPLPRTRLGKYRRHLLPEIYASAQRGEAGPAAPHTPEDEALLAEPRVRRLWNWLEERFADRALTLDTSPQFDLGVDSLGWIELAAELEAEHGVRLDEAALGQIVTLRDLLRAVAASAPRRETAEEPAAATAGAEAERWLAPAGAFLTALGFVMYAILWLGCRAYFRLKVDSAAALPGVGPYVLAANHCSDLDPLVVAAALPWRIARQVYWSADIGRLFGTRLRRLFARAAHCFPVDDRKPATSLALGAEVLRRGHVLVWFPEEWRSPDGTLQSFLPGIGALLDKTGARVVPVHIDGTFAAMPRGASWPRPRRVRLRFGAPLEPDELMRGGSGAERARGLAAGLRERVAALAGEAPSGP